MRNFLKQAGFGDDRPFLVAEVAQTHEGSIGSAFAFIDAAASNGADAIKFQTHIADAESTLDEPWRVPFSPNDLTRFDYWRRMEFTASQWADLASYAQERGLFFLSSPFSSAAVEILKDLKMPFWKVASGEVLNPDLMEEIWKTNMPVVFSSGLTGWDVLSPLVETAQRRGTPIAILQCTSAYPCPPAAWGLNEVVAIRDRFNCMSGFSDHSGTIFPSLAAAALGANIIEVHVTFSKMMFGPDVSSSVTFEQLAMIRDGISQISSSIKSDYVKQGDSDAAIELQQIFGRSWAPKHDLREGHVLGATDLVLKKPGTGYSFAEKDELIGRRLTKAKPANRIFSEEDFF